MRRPYSVRRLFDSFAFLVCATGFAMTGVIHETGNPGPDPDVSAHAGDASPRAVVYRSAGMTGSVPTIGWEKIAYWDRGGDLRDRPVRTTHASSGLNVSAVFPSDLSSRVRGPY